MGGCAIPRSSASGRTRRRLVGALSISALSAAAPRTSAANEGTDAPEAEARHCLHDARSKWVLHSLLAGQVNATGAELSARLGLCVPLFTRPSVLFARTHVEVGLVEYLSPAYGQLGGYAQVTPLSFLKLRSELSGLAYWPFPFPRAGYFGLESYEADFGSEALPKEEARGALGWNLNLIGILQLRLPLGGRVSAVVYSMWTAEHWNVGSAPFYFNVRRDLPLARRDWVLTTESVVAAEIEVTPSWSLRPGVFDSWRAVPASGYAANEVGLFAGAHFPRPAWLPGSVHDFQPFVRVGVYTAHRFRTGTLSALAGIMTSYDLGPL